MDRDYERILRPDAKGRIFLGKLAEGVSSYHAYMDKDHRIILEPFTEIPLREKWLFENQQAYESVQRGLEDSNTGVLKGKGTFSRYLDADE
jgi:hypothetical protein